MHLGNVFSLLMAWLGARSAGGEVVLRIEDLDPRAQRRQVADVLRRDLEWLGLDWDEGPHYQSDRRDLYAEALGRLDGLGLTYPCFCSRAELHVASAPHLSDGTYLYQGTCRHLSPDEVAERRRAKSPAIRLIVPESDSAKATVRFEDLVYGPQSSNLALDCGDFVICRGDGVFAYQLAVVVDDATMGVTQVVRGHDLLGSVARQMYLQRLLGFATPSYAHVPLLVASDGRRLSKRDRDLDLGVLRERRISASQIIGNLAASVGLVERGARITPEELVGSFDWNAIATHRDDIVVADAM